MFLILILILILFSANEVAHDLRRARHLLRLLHLELSGRPDHKAAHPVWADDLLGSIFLRRTSVLGDFLARLEVGDNEVDFGRVRGVRGRPQQQAGRGRHSAAAGWPARHRGGHGAAGGAVLAQARAVLSLEAGPVAVGARGAERARQAALGRVGSRWTRGTDGVARR
jgi:hypothetical protein